MKKRTKIAYLLEKVDESPSATQIHKESFCELSHNIFIYIGNSKMEEELLQVSEDGNLSKVSQILKTCRTNIN